MGQKVNPIGLRLALKKNWSSRWYAGKKDFGNWLLEDQKIRNFIRAGYRQSGIAKVFIERFGIGIRITVFVAKPADIVGAKGANVDKLKTDICKILKRKDAENIILDIVEVRDAETNAQCVSDDIAMQLERRIGFRRAMKKAIQTAMEKGAEGIKIQCGGRIGNAELARTEHYKEGRTPLHTLKAHIDYGFSEANTTAGKLGIKVWICHKEPTEVMQNAVNAKKGKAQKGAAR